MPNGTDVKKEKDLSPESLLQTLVEATHSKLKKQTEAGLVAGAKPDELAASLLRSISRMQFPTGEKEGVLSGLMRGHGVSRQEMQAPLGIEKSAVLLNQILGAQKSLQDLQAGTPEGQARVVAQKQAEAEATARGGLLAKQTLAQEELNRNLNIYFEVGNYLPTGDGMERFTVGMDNIIQSVESKTPAGLAAGRIDALNKVLRVKLVRAAGDVGNLNIVEQLAAEQMLFNNFDSTGMRGLKKTLLQLVNNGVNSKDPQVIKDAVSQWMKSGYYEEVTPEFKSTQEAMKANIPFGTKVNINGEEYIWKKKEKKAN